MKIKARLTTLTLIACYATVVASLLGNAPNYEDVADEYIEGVQTVFQAHRAVAPLLNVSVDTTPTIVVYKQQSIEPVQSFHPVIHKHSRYLARVLYRPPNEV